jgi:1,2-diacylglycerol 3-beta-galactosyltransferase
VRVTGLPVNPCFVDGLVDKMQARRVLGWPLDRPAVLVIGGGEGMGRLHQTACAIEATCPGVQLAVVTGRNRRLREQLEVTNWCVPIHVYGFVDHAREMPRLMSAADLLITKAGPGTLHEAFLAGLPLILSGAIPGQEQGNVRLVVDSGAGVWAPDPRQAAALVARWMDSDRDALTRMAACSRTLARPHAAAAAADEIWELLYSRNRNTKSGCKE